MRQAAFENDGHTRPNILALTTTALTLVGAVAISGCASEGQSNSPAPGVEQISNADIDISGLNEEQQDIFKGLIVQHDGTLAGLSSTAQHNQNLVGGANSEAFNGLTVEINGRDINCGVAANIWFLADEMPADFESADFDPAQYERTCDGSPTTKDLALIIPYLATMKQVIEEDSVLKTMQPELAAGMIQQTGQELILAVQNSETRQTIVDDISFIAETWTGPGYVPNEAEVSHIVDTATEMYGVTSQILPEGDVVSLPETPEQTETTQPAIEPEFELNVSDTLGIPVDEGAKYPLLNVQTDYENADLNEAKINPYYNAADDTFIPCAEYLGVAECSDTQARALYTASNVLNSLYSVPGAISESAPDAQAFTLFNLLVRANDPDLQATERLDSYTVDSLVTDVQSQLHREVPSAEVEEVVSMTLDTLGIELSER